MGIFNKMAEIFQLCWDVCEWLIAAVLAMFVGVMTLLGISVAVVVLYVWTTTL